MTTVGGRGLAGGPFNMIIFGGIGLPGGSVMTITLGGVGLEGTIMILGGNCLPGVLMYFI